MADHRSLPLTDLSEDEKLFQDTVKSFADEKIRPLVSKMDAEAKMPRDLIDACFELGLMGIEIPESFGGAASTFFMSVLVVEELAKVDASVAVLVDVQNTLFNNALLRWGTEAQKAKYFPKLATKWVGAYALSEAGSGSDAFALACKATDKGDHYELTGQKLWITNAIEADLFIVIANADLSKGYKGITAFLVEKGTPGFTIGKKEDKLGIRASSTCELIFEGCKVPKENVLGEVGKGYKIAIETLNEGRIGIAAQMVGVAQGAYEHALKYAQERKQFGQAIAEFQGVQFELSNMAMRSKPRVFSPTTRRASATPAPASSRRRPWRSSSPRAPRSTWPARPSRSSAATASPANTRWRSTSATRKWARSTRALRTCSSW